MKTRRVLSRICSTKRFCVLAFIYFLLCLAQAPVIHASLQAAAALEPATVSPSQHISFTITISWQGDADAYIIVPPAPVFPEGMKQVSSSFSSTVNSDMQRMHYCYTLKADGQGDFTIKPVQINYWEKGSDTQQSLTTEEVSAKVASFAFFKLYRTWIIAGAALVLAGVLIVLIVGYKKRGERKKKQSGLQQDTNRDIMEMIERCRGHKIKGDAAGFYQCALAAAQRISGDDRNLIDSVAGMLEKVQFGGYTPPAEETDRIFRQLEKKAGGITASDAQKELDYAKYCK